MSTNPYQPPDVQSTLSSSQIDGWHIACHSLRLALLILLVPAVYNFVCFHLRYNGSRIDLSMDTVFLAINSCGFLLIAAAIWFLGVLALEFITRVLHSIFSRSSRLDDWREALYDILRRAPFFAVPGAVMWVIWVHAFYQLRLGFYAVSVPIGIVAHVIAACFYVPLIYRWYKLERTSASKITS